MQGRAKGASAGLPWGQVRAQEGVSRSAYLGPYARPTAPLHLVPRQWSRGHMLHPPSSPPSHPCSWVLAR